MSKGTIVGKPASIPIHVLPVNDLREHVEAPDCWCQPRLEIEESFLTGRQTTIVVHYAADGRDLVEQSGVN